MAIGERLDDSSDRDPRIRRALETAIAHGTIDETVARLSGFLARHVSGADSAERVDALIRKAFEEILLTGQHDALFDSREDLFRFLARVTRAIARRPQCDLRGQIFQLRRK